MPRRGVSLLKNSFVPFSEPCSDAECPAFRHFEPDPGPPIDPVATFSTGSRLSEKWLGGLSGAGVLEAQHCKNRHTLCPVFSSS
jgi:hypothetical protein